MTSVEISSDLSDIASRIRVIVKDHAVRKGDVSRMFFDSKSCEKQLVDYINGLWKSGVLPIRHKNNQWISSVDVTYYQSDSITMLDYIHVQLIVNGPKKPSNYKPKWTKLTHKRIRDELLQSF